MIFYTWHDELTLDEQADGLDMIDLCTVNGEIMVRGADVKMVQIVAARLVRASDEKEGLACLEALRPEAARQNSTLIVRIPYFETRHERLPDARQVRVDLSVTVPAHFTVRADTRNGAIRVAGVEHNVDVVTRNGEVDVRGVGGDVDARSQNGHIVLDGVGSVTRAKTTNGAIHADVRSVPEQATLKTMNGAISLRVPPDAAFTLWAQTALGAIQTDWGKAHGRMGLACRYEADVNGGGVPVQLQTGNGAIRVMRGD